MAAHDMTLHGKTYDIHYIHDIHHIRDIHYIHYIHYRQYIQYIRDIQDIHDIHYRHIAFPEVSIHDTTRHDFTSHPDVWQLRAWEGEGDRGKKKQSCAHSCCQRLLTPQAHALPSACRAESCLLFCQREHPSVATCQIIMNYSMIALQTAS